MINESEADWLHMDVMTVFVPNILSGSSPPPYPKTLQEKYAKPMMYNFMIVHPENYIQQTKDSQQSRNATTKHVFIFIVHMLSQSAGMKAGVTLQTHQPRLMCLKI